MPAEFRGVGKVHTRKAIACVVELWHRVPDADGKRWTPARPFTPGIPKTAERCFTILNAVPNRIEGKRVLRDLHPAFEAFNYTSPKNARMLRCRLVHWYERECYTKHLGAWKGPPGRPSPETGFWCSGDGKQARRWESEKWCDLQCPERLCEFSQEGSGPGGQGQWCKPHLSLVAQFDWPEGNLLPRAVFEWSSQSWHNVGNLDGLFLGISGLAVHLGHPVGTFPVIGLAFTMHLKERVQVKKGHRFPEVSFSTEGDPMDWMRMTHKLAQDDAARQAALLEAPKPMEALPPPGFTAQQMQEAQEASLSPHYVPRNVR